MSSILSSIGSSLNSAIPSAGSQGLSGLVSGGSQAPATAQPAPTAPLPGTPSFSTAAKVVDPTSMFSPRQVPASWQPMIQNVYKAYPNLSPGIVQSILMNESSMGTYAGPVTPKTPHGYYDPKNPSAWLGGITGSAIADQSRIGKKTDTTTQQGVLNAIGSYMTQLQTEHPNVKDQSQLYLNHYANASARTPAGVKKFNAYMKYYTTGQYSPQKLSLPSTARTGKESPKMKAVPISLASNLQ